MAVAVVPFVIPAAEAIWGAIVLVGSAIGVGVGIGVVKDKIDKSFSDKSLSPVQMCKSNSETAQATPKVKNSEAKESTEITPEDLKDKTKQEIEELAKEKGLLQDSKNPGKFRDPVTGKERLRIDEGHIDKVTGKPYDNPNAARPHTHGYDRTGKPIVDPATGDKHFPLKN